MCAVCGYSADGLPALAAHLVAEAERSDVAHVMWLNRNVTKHRVGVDELCRLLAETADGRSAGGDRVAR